MNKKIKRIAVPLCCIAIAFASCQKDEAPVPENKTDFSEGPAGTEVILGKEIPNPYSLSYMRQALKELSEKSLSKSASDYQIEANFLHVRFLPKDDAEFETLLSDTTIELFDRPMLCEVEQEGDSYHDPSLPEDAITWQYTTVPVDYKFPNIKYEVLDSCFVPEDMDEELQLSKKSSAFNPLDLTSIAFRLAGQEYEKEGLSKKRAVPSGQFRVWDNYHNQWTGIRGIKVIVYNGIRWDHTHTDVDGSYRMSKHYATKNIHYRIKFRTSDDIIINNLMFDIDAADEGLGWHSKSGYSRDFDTNSKVWMWATVNNAVNIFKKELCPHFKIAAPNVKLHIFASKHSAKNWSGCTPMCRHMRIKLANWERFCVHFLGLQPMKIAANLLGPDMMVFYNNSTRSVYSTVFHEMGHVCHYKKVGKRYWQNYAQFVITHTGYGEKSDSKSGYVGVGEMWGYYFGNYACDTYYFGDRTNWNPSYYWFRPDINYGLQFQAGLQPYQILECMTSHVTSHELLKQALKKKYPSKLVVIENEFNNCGF